MDISDEEDQQWGGLINKSNLGKICKERTVDKDPRDLNGDPLLAVANNVDKFS